MAAAVATTTILSTPASAHKNTDDALRTPTKSPVAAAKVGATVAKPAAKPDADTPEPETPEAMINMDTFQQLLELDEDDTHDFSRGMVDAYFSQAESTFDDMDQALKSSDLPKLSSLGHFLKGSSATLGVSRVEQSCQKIQHYGEKKNEGKDLSDTEALSRIGELLGKVKVDFRTAEEWLQKWYEDNSVEEEED